MLAGVPGQPPGGRSTLVSVWPSHFARDSGRAIERPPPRVAQADDVDLRLAAAVRVRIVGGDAVRLAVRRVIDVDPEDLAEQRLALAWIRRLRRVNAHAARRGEIGPQ